MTMCIILSLAVFYSFGIVGLYSLRIDNDTDTCYVRTCSKADWKIAYTRRALQSENIPRSVCLDCATCLAVAQKLNETLVTAHGDLYSRKKLENVPAMLHSLCKNGFLSYILCEVEGHIALVEYAWCPKELHSEMDGTWTTWLRRKCDFYLGEIDPNRLYRQWLGSEGFPSYQMDSILCRSTGSLRECFNMDDMKVVVRRKPPNLPLITDLRVGCPLSRES